MSRLGDLGRPILTAESVCNRRAGRSWVVAKQLPEGNVMEATQCPLTQSCTEY